MRRYLVLIKSRLTRSSSLINIPKKDISKSLQNQLDNFKAVCGTDEFENTHNTSII